MSRAFGKRPFSPIQRFYVALFLSYGAASRCFCCVEARRGAASVPSTFKARGFFQAFP